MSPEAQEKVFSLIREQADKLAMALKALREIKRLTKQAETTMECSAFYTAEDALKEISDYGKHPEDL